MFPWAVKHAQWLINRSLSGADGKTAYNCRIDAKLTIGTGRNLTMLHWCAPSLLLRLLSLLSPNF